MSEQIGPVGIAALFGALVAMTSGAGRRAVGLALLLLITPMLPRGHRPDWRRAGGGRA